MAVPVPNRICSNVLIDVCRRVSAAAIRMSQRLRQTPVLTFLGQVSATLRDGKEIEGHYDLLQVLQTPLKLKDSGTWLISPDHLVFWQVCFLD